MLLRCYGPPDSECSYCSWIVCKLYAISRNLFIIVPKPGKSKTKTEAVLEFREDRVFAFKEVFIGDLDMVERWVVCLCPSIQSTSQVHKDGVLMTVTLPKAPPYCITQHIVAAGGF